MRNVIILGLLLIATPAFALDGSLYAHFLTGSAMGLAADTVMYHYAEDMGAGRTYVGLFRVGLDPWDYQ